MLNKKIVLLCIGAQLLLVYSCKQRKAGSSSNLEETTTINGKEEDLTKYKNTFLGEQPTEGEIAAFKLYSSEKKTTNDQPWYTRINTALRNRDRYEIQELTYKILDISSFINKLRVGSCEFRRYLNAPANVVNLLSRKGNTYVDQGFFSTTENRTPPAGFGDRQHTIIGTSKRCARVWTYSVFQNEREILFPPGSEFEVVADSNGREFFIREIDLTENSKRSGPRINVANDSDWDRRMRIEAMNNRINDSFNKLSESPYIHSGLKKDAYKS
ncbi:MAG: ADP-ribosyltransferase domain-containing protein, partial [Proteobacteria bacterium]|nr:ADP-ribosyltransferase domain-containing protein [Pseudomonadota bacterium]